MDRLDVECAKEVSALLQPLPSHEIQYYFEQLVSQRQCRGIKVKQNGEFGKGVYAETDIKEGDLVLKDQMLFGSQHPSNRIGCLVCSFCFRFIGSIELQIGRRLFLEGLANCGNTKCDVDSSDEEDGSSSQGHENIITCGSSSFKVKTPLPGEVVESLKNGELLLPYSNRFSLPQPISCLGGCGEVYYCSNQCAEADWEMFHSLLCTGERLGSQSRHALAKFIEHAHETNDIFLLAAKAIAFTVLRYRKLKAAFSKEQENSAAPRGMLALPLLLEAWKPISIGYKKRWWDCMALPDDVDSSDERAFRLQVKELAFTSLQLLKAAIFDKECEPLFSLEIYGHIIGMFELNNLELVVASPVEDYFLFIDDLPHAEKIIAKKDTRRILDALGDDYSVSCQGTAFFPLHSCMNHSCLPNAKAFKREEDRDGHAIIIALRPISKGEEVTISYIDEDLPFEERQTTLADYGFKCTCAKCSEEDNNRSKHLY